MIAGRNGNGSFPLWNEITDEDSSTEDGITVTSLAEMLEKQGYRCALSGRELTPDNCTLDHIIPVTEGGEHALSNVQLVTAEVNAAKGSMSNDAFKAMCRDVTSCDA